MSDLSSSMLRRREILVATLLSPFTSVSANNQETWPQKPIRIIVPYPAGGLADFLARHSGNAMGKKLGVPVIVENKPGGGANIGATMVARAAHDGYTLLLITSTHVANALLFKNSGYNPVKDFSPISILADANTAVVTNVSSPFRNLADVLAYAKANPDELAYGSPGIGSPGHLAAELLKQKTGISMRHVPYQGAPQAAQDVVGGVTPIAFVNLNVAQPLIQTNRLRALAVTGAKRWVSLPDVPTIGESGVTGYAWSSWMGLAAPAGTPEPVITMINKSVTGNNSEASMHTIIQQGSDPVFSTAEEMRVRLASDMKTYATVIQEAGIRSE